MAFDPSNGALPCIAQPARWCARRLALLALLAVGFLASPVWAQDVPLDVADVAEAEAGRALPDAPDGFTRERHGDVQWEFPSQTTTLVHGLQEVLRQEWPRLVRELGSPIDAALTIRIGRDPEQMRALAPPEAPPPAYASGVAYPHRGLILLTLTAPETWQRPDVESVLVHELSHVALHRAIDGHPIARWFTEGVAIYQADEKSLQRVEALWRGTVSERLLPLGRLSRGFPSQPHQVNLAYAQSADFIRWLIGRQDGAAKFAQVIRRLREGQTLDTALERTYSVSLTRLELDWHADLEERYQAMPLLLGSGTLWVGAALLIVMAYARRRKRDRTQLDAWEEEERAQVAAATAWLETKAAPSPREAPERSPPSTEVEVLYVIPPEPRSRDAGVPTIEHEGRNHTLH
ncbi:MAG: hypothetical protein AB8I08_34680 [Sandaracinaceae bacterium]